MDKLNFLLHNLLERVSGTNCAILLTVDGLKRNWAGVDTDTADSLAATAASLCGLSNRVGLLLSGQNSLRQVIVELSDSILFVTSASTGTVLAVAAHSNVEIGVLSYEINQLCKKVASHFSVQGRATAGNGGPR